MGVPSDPWYPLVELQQRVRDGDRYFGTLAARQLVERGWAADDVWACLLVMDEACFCKSGISRHPLHVGETWDAYKAELYGRRTWLELTVDMRDGRLKVISVHPTK